MNSDTLLPMNLPDNILVRTSGK